MKKILKFIGLILLVIILITAGWIGFVMTQFSVKEIGIIDTKPEIYVGIKAQNVEMKDYPKVMGDAFEKLENLWKENPETVFGKAFSIYQKSQTGEYYDLTMGYTLESENINLDNDFVIGLKKPILAKRYEYKGSYSYLMYGWMYVISKANSDDTYILDENSPSYETYEVGYIDNVEPKDFVTIIDIPVVINENSSENLIISAE